jgi:hypothetical protein
LRKVLFREEARDIVANGRNGRRSGDDQPADRRTDRRRAEAMMEPENDIAPFREVIVRHFPELQDAIFEGG